MPSLLRWALRGGRGVNRQGGGGGGVVASYHVDSVNGDDGNDGRTIATAFATLGAVPTLNAGESVGLARGSTWQETLAPAANSITILAYGTGDDPLIDCGSAALSSDGWDDSTDRADANTNVYSRTITLESAVAQHFINCYEDDANLTLAASVAACQSAAGSYFVTSHTSDSTTLYIHPTGSTDPASNGSVYQHSQREYAINAGARSGMVIRGIHARRNLHNNGSIYCGRNALVDDCVINDGGAHNLLLADGSILQNSTVQNAASATSGAMIVFYDNNPTGVGNTVRNCTFTNPAWNVNINAVFCHSDGTGDMGVLTVEDCTFNNINLCITMEDVTASFARRNTANDCKQFYRAALAIVHTLSGNTVDSVIAGQTVLAVGTQTAGATINITDDVHICDNPANGAVVVTHSSVILVINNLRATLLNAATTSGVVFINSSLTGVELTLNDSELISNAGQNIRALAEPSAYVGDRNCYDLNNGIAIRWGASTYSSLATWQAVTEQDASSTVDNC